MVLTEIKRRKGHFDLDFMFGGRFEAEGVRHLRVDLIYEDGRFLCDGDFVMNDAQITVVVVEEAHQEKWRWWP